MLASPKHSRTTVTTSNANRPVALITGGARRLGAAIARALHAAGYDLLLHARHSIDAATDLAGELMADSGRVECIQADLQQDGAAERLVEAAIDRFGRLDVLVNNASAFYPTPLGSITPAQVDELFASNARAPLFLAQAAAPWLRRQRGAVLNMVDIYADRPLPDYLPYCMAKAALVALTYGLARELGPEVRVNAIAPGNILWSENMEKAETPAIVAERTALQRQGDPDSLAKAARFLLCEADYVTGQVLRVDGGRWLFI
ncbi:MAG: pteridine reductase [Xanthomonadales bacterium]|nr:pteridine reductase [Xanthomonadales bacterium]MCB1629561.1 pteridine reductase [Xanthomonadales bacterium]MCB1636152.1 pteridine reductase [Xanthomonadales bacterium]